MKVNTRINLLCRPTRYYLINIHNPYNTFLGTPINNFYRQCRYKLEIILLFPIVNFQLSISNRNDLFTLSQTQILSNNKVVGNGHYIYGDTNMFSTNNSCYTNEDIKPKHLIIYNNRRKWNSNCIVRQIRVQSN